MKQYTKLEKAFLVKNYPIYGSPYCSKKLNRSRDALIAFCNRNKIICVNKHYIKNEDRNVNPKHFDNIVLPEVAYFLGLCWGDGYISSEYSYQIRLDFKKEDGEYFFKVLCQFGKWNMRLKKRNDQNNWQSIISIGNKPIWNFLNSCNYSEKSLVSPSKILSKIPLSLRNLFWLGFFDADGCVHYNQKTNKYFVSFTGTYEQDWSELINLLNNLQIRFCYSKGKYKNNTSKSTIYIGSKNGIKSLRNYLYKKRIGLPRKKEKFMSLCQSFT